MAPPFRTFSQPMGKYFLKAIRPDLFSPVLSPAASPFFLLLVTQSIQSATTLITVSTYSKWEQRKVSSQFGAGSVFYCTARPADASAVSGCPRGGAYRNLSRKRKG